MFKRIAGIIIGVIFVVVYILLPVGLNISGSNENTDFIGEQKGPRGTFDFASDLEGYGYTVRTIVTTTSTFNKNMVDPKNTIYITAGVERRYTTMEIDAIKQFVKDGGHAIVTDDFGNVGPLADAFNITYYKGQFFDQNYDKNVNFPVCEAVLGTDEGRWVLDDNHNAEPNSAGQRKRWDEEKDGVWDDDDDADGIVDEDILDGWDNDQDNRKLKRDEIDNDFDSDVDNFNEGIDEDTWDDDGDWIDENGNGFQDPYEIGVNEERLNGINDDAEVKLFPALIIESEDYTEKYRRKLNNGELPSEVKDAFKNKIHFTISNDSTFIEMTDDNEWLLEYKNWKFKAVGRKMLNEDDYYNLTFYKLDDRIDEDLYHYKLVMNTPVGIYSFKTETNIIGRGSKNSYVDLNQNGKIELPEIHSTGLADRVSTGQNRIELILEVTDPFFVGKGSIIFMPDADIFTNDLYSLDHMSIDINSVFHDIKNEEEELNLSTTDKNDINNIADNTPDGRADYDNKIFMEDLIFYLTRETKENGATNDEILILIDDSLHGEEKRWLVPTYSTLKIASIVTSETCFIVVSAFVLSGIIFFSLLTAKGRENWSHNFNVKTFRKRRGVPVGTSLKKRRLKEIVLDIARMNKGLSAEEFKEISGRDVDGLIGDPGLIQLVRENKNYTEEEITQFIEKINKWKK